MLTCYVHSRQRYCFILESNDFRLILLVTSILDGLMSDVSGARLINKLMPVCSYGIGSGSVVPCLTTVVSKYGAPTQKGTILGIFRSLGALARAVGPMLSATGKAPMTRNSW